MSEIWKDIEGYEGLYQVSNLGRVKSLDRIDCRGQHREPKFMKARPTKQGYLRVGLWKNGKVKTVSIHRLVAEAFISKNFTVNHKDGNKSNNTVDNLEWMTQKENNIHAYETGLKSQGEQWFNSKFSKEQVIEIRKNYIPFSEEYGKNALAKKYNVAPSTIYNIVTKKTYKNVE